MTYWHWRVFFSPFLFCSQPLFYFENFLFVIYSLVWKPMSGKKNIQYCFNDGHSFIILAWIKSIIRFKYVIVYVCATNGLVECIFIVYFFFFNFRAFVWNFPILFKIISWNKKKIGIRAILCTQNHMNNRYLIKSISIKANTMSHLKLMSPMKTGWLLLTNEQNWTDRSNDQATVRMNEWMEMHCIRYSRAYTFNTPTLHSTWK